MAIDLRDRGPAFLEFWRERHLCSLTTVRPDGTAHVVPVGVTLEPAAGLARVITFRGSRKVALIRGFGPLAGADEAAPAVTASVSFGDGCDVVHGEISEIHAPFDGSENLRDAGRGRPARAGSLPGAPVAVCQIDGGRWSTLEGLAVVRDSAAAVAEAERRYAERYRTPRLNPLRVVVEIRVTRVLGTV